MTPMKFVDFYHYCPLCINKDRPECKPPCSECIAIPARPDSHKPEKYERDPNYVDPSQNLQPS